ncbi:hypothetical protein BJF82_12735 [Kytococcus sp. CUA-901]|nr:hypothetical protein BJF82_12735 [Kytococcus sp. CUA-901]
MAIPLVLWLLRDPGRFATDLLGINQSATVIPWAWAIAAATVVAYVAYTFWAVPFVRENATSVSGLKFLAIPLALVSGTLEELLFRRFLMDWLDSLTTPGVLQVLASAVAFGARTRSGCCSHETRESSSPWSRQRPHWGPYLR